MKDNVKILLMAIAILANFQSIAQNPSQPVEILENIPIDQRLFFCHEKKTKEFIYSSSLDLTISREKVLGFAVYDSKTISGEILGWSQGTFTGFKDGNFIYTFETNQSNEIGHNITNRRFIMDKNSLAEISNENIFYTLCKDKALNKNEGKIKQDFLPGVCRTSADGYSSDTYLFPKYSQPDSLKKYFGLSTFNPLIANGLTMVSEQKIINNMTVDCIVQSVAENRFIYHPNAYVPLNLSKVPELTTLFERLKNKDKYEIAAEKNVIIAKILETRKLYDEAQSKYQKTTFQISGNCFAYEDEYDFDKQIVFVHLFIDVGGLYGIYLATIKADLSLEEAKILFSQKKVDGKVSYLVLPGNKTLGLGIAAGGGKRYRVPDMILTEFPFVVFTNVDKKIRFTTPNLNGQLWPSTISTYRWDLHKPDHPDRQNIRIVEGISF